MNFYVHEKLIELEEERRRQLPLSDLAAASRRKPVFGALAARAGRTLRRAGESLEAWANPPLAEHDQPIARRVAH